MKKIIPFFAICLLPAASFADLHEESLYGTPQRSSGASGDRIAMDMEDPMFFEQSRDFVSRTGAFIGNEVLLLSQRFSYGVNGNMVFSADVKFQESFHSDNDGFSNIGFMAAYRASDGNIKTDVFAGVNFTGAASVPNYANTVYAAGARVGRQWSWVTLAGALQTSWIFDENNGVAYIDLIPDVYFRLGWDWSLGAGAVLRKSTNPAFDQEWVGGRIAKRYGRTMYVGSFDYEIESEEWRLGARLNLLF